MKTAIFLSMRNKSKRLPGKHFLEIKGKTITEHLIDRLKKANLPIVLCTSINPDDKALVEMAEKEGIESFQGSEEDKLDRYLKAAEEYGIDFILVVDGDDIFCDPEYIQKIVEKFRETNADFIMAKGLPLGATAFGVKKDALAKVCELKKEDDTEVWGGYFTETDMFDDQYVEAEQDVRYPELRMTLDYQEDFDFFKRIFDELGQDFSLKQTVELVRKKPEIFDINSGVQKKYEEHLKEAAAVKMEDG